MPRTTEDRKRGKRWNFTTLLKDCDFAGDTALMSSRFSDLEEKTNRLVEEAEGVGLKLNAKKCKTLRTHRARNKENIEVKGEMLMM